MIRVGKLKKNLCPAILIGGGANTLSVARSLRRKGVLVLSLGRPGSEIRYSRFCEWITLKSTGNIQDAWLEWLTGPARKKYAGAVILPCDDDGLELVARDRSKLQADFVVFEANDKVLEAMLDKAKSYELARQAGIPTPQVCVVDSADDLHRVMQEVTFPCALKPRVSHEFKKFFDKKLFVVNTAQELESAFGMVRPLKLQMIVTEIIPGGDAGYCSYYSYIDESGKPLFHFTKRKLRQYPNGFGYGTYHLTDWNPEVAELGLRFFQRAGIRGLANVEFKRDPRDNELKLIECNHRFTEANELVRLSGIDLALLVYNRLTGRPLPRVDNYRRGVCMVSPLQDIKSFRGLLRRGEISWSEWLGSFLRPVHFLYFKWYDPMPTLYQFSTFLVRQLKRIIPGVLETIPRAILSHRVAAKSFVSDWQV